MSLSTTQLEDSSRVIKEDVEDVITTNDNTISGGSVERTAVDSSLTNTFSQRSRRGSFDINGMPIGDDRFQTVFVRENDGEAMSQNDRLKRRIGNVFEKIKDSTIIRSPVPIYNHDISIQSVDEEQPIPGSSGTTNRVVDNNSTSTYNNAAAYYADRNNEIHRGVSTTSINSIVHKTPLSRNRSAGEASSIHSGTSTSLRKANSIGGGTHQKQYRLEATRRRKHVKNKFLRCIYKYLCCGSNNNTSSSYGLPTSSSLTTSLHWLFRVNFFFLFVMSCIIFFAFTFIFAAFITIAGTMDPQCVRIGSDEFGSKGTEFADAFALSWTTFSTVGYGSTYPALGHENNNPTNCAFITVVCSLESFIGVLYSGFCGAILFGKVLRIQSHAQVIFSDPLVVRYGSGVSEQNQQQGNDNNGNEHANNENGNQEGNDEDDKGTTVVRFLDDDNSNSTNNDNPSSSITNRKNRSIINNNKLQPKKKKKKRKEIKKIPCPVLEFRIINRLFNEIGGEIMDATLNCVANIDADDADTSSLRTSSNHSVGRGSNHTSGEIMSSARNGFVDPEDSTHSNNSSSRFLNQHDEEFLQVPSLNVAEEQQQQQLTQTSGSTVDVGGGGGANISIDEETARIVEREQSTRSTTSVSSTGSSLLNFVAKPLSVFHGSLSKSRTTRNGHKSRSSKHHKSGENGDNNNVDGDNDDGVILSTLEEDPTSKLVSKRIFTKLLIEASDHPFFKRVWLCRHVLDETSPILTPRVRKMIRKCDGYWPESLNNPEDVRKSLKFNQILVSLNGVSNVSASDVYAQKIYDYVDMSIGYQFVNVLYRDDKDDTLKVDVDLINDVREQKGGGGEDLF